MISFKEIPEWWAICPNESCPMADSCLRHYAYVNVPEDVVKWSCVLPHLLKDGQCPKYQKTELVTLAKGFKSTFNVVKSREGKHMIRECLQGYFGSNGSYYRYHDGKRVLNPEVQKYIRDLFVECGGCKEEDVKFDETFTSYDFTRV